MFFYAKKVLILLILFFFSQSVLAIDIVETETVTISANVGGLVVSDGGSGNTSYLPPVEIPQTAVKFSGYAYPFAQVSISKQGKVALVVTTDQTGFFTATLEEEFDDTILYSVIATDLSGFKSLLLNYPLVVSRGYVTHLSGILFAPTIFLDKNEAIQNSFLTVSGYALPQEEVEIFIKGSKDKVFSLLTNKDGTYRITLPLKDMPKGEYSVYLKYKDSTKISKIIKFLISDKDILNLENILEIPGDCNRDNVINLVDFSVLAFWYKRPNPPICVDVKRDNIVDLIDFSIVAYYWTG